MLQAGEKSLIVNRENLMDTFIPETEIKRDPKGEQWFPILMIEFQPVIVNFHEKVPDEFILQHRSVGFLAEPDTIQKWGIDGIPGPVR